MPLVAPGVRVSAAGTSSLPTNNLAWYGHMAWDGGSRIVAASYAGTKTAYSTDNGLTWTGVTVSSANYYGCGYIPGVFVVIINNSRDCLYSSDGTSWSTATNAFPTARAWQRVVGGNDTLVTMSYGGTYTATSTNGTSWTEYSGLTTASTFWNSLAFGDYSGGRFVVVANSTSGGASTNRAMYSSDNGATWTAATLPSSGLGWSVAYGNGVFVATRNSTAGAYSTDGGATWTAATMPSSGNWIPAYAGNGVFIATSNGNPTTTGAISYDLGKTWSAWTFPASAWWETTGTNAGDRVVWMGRASNTGMYLATSKAGPTTIVQAVTRSASF